ncbi:MAG: copper resistance CopC/CopD family protein [Actinomycetota bacterium]
MRGRTRKVGLILLGGIGFLLLVAGPAAAHAGFVSSSPAPGSSLSTAPGVVVLEFTEPLNQSLSRATVTAPDGLVFLGTPTGERQISIPLAANAVGVYEVSWTTVSTFDGHTLTGRFGFGVGVDPGPGSIGGTRDEPGVGDLLIAIARTAEDAALLLAIGLVLLGRLSGQDVAIPWVRARPTGTLAVAVLAGSVVVLGEGLLAAQSFSPAGIATYLTSGLPGIARLVRPGLELLALLLAWFRPRWALFAILAALVALSSAGHAAAISPPWWGITAEAVHLTSAGLWAGGILALALQKPPSGWRGDDGRELLSRFTPVALAASAVTAVTGLVRGFQETGGIGGLMSSYGVVLLLKIILVLVMVQLSVLAWRRIVVRPRVESMVVVTILGAAALLASFPLPPGRVSESDRPGVESDGGRALPTQGEMSLGSNAGQVLVGLTIRPNDEELAIYLLGLEGPDEDARRVVTLTIDGRRLSVSQCGSRCRKVATSVEGGEDVTIGVSGPSGGEAHLTIPDLEARAADDLLDLMTQRMHSVSSFRLTETLGAGPTRLRSEYEVRAPDAIHVLNVQADGGGSEVILIGDTRYLRELPEGRWELDQGVATRVPSYVWDSFEPFIGARIVGQERIGGDRTAVIAFFGGDEQVPAWFRLWIAPDGLVLRAEMDAPGHFMDQRYYDFGARIRIKPPVEARP